MKIRFLKAIILATVLTLPIAAAAQKAGVKTVKKPTKPAPVVTAPPQPAPEPVPEVPVKRNERPADTAAASGIKASSRDGASNASSVVPSPVYSYEFERLGFTYSPILIEHNDAGKGKISFKKDGSGDLLTDPINLSAVTIEKIKAAFAALNFLDSTENYQYVKDFSNMGNVRACGPSESATAGSGCTSTMIPSTPVAAAARAIGVTATAFPVPCDGSTMIGR